MDLLSWVLITLATIVLAGIVAFTVIVRALYKRVQRSRALLRARSRFSWGPQHEVLKLRLRLKDTLDSGQAAVDLALRSDGPRGELPRLFRRIQSEGVALEYQLRLMASETDPDVFAEGLPVARRRVEQVATAVRGLRSAVAAGLGDLSDDTLATLRSDVDREVAALKAGVQELRTLNGYDGYEGLSGPRRQLSMDRLARGNES